MMKYFFYITFFIVAINNTLNAQTIISSRHNLSINNSGDTKSFTEDGVCGYCHTPHDKNPMTPGWNKNSPGKTYILYDNTISNTFQAIPGQPDGSSVLCLSCHDGTTALGKVTAGPMLASYGRSSYDKSGRGNLTTDLSDDHPVSFVFDASLATVDGQLQHPPLAPVTLDINEKVQCVSCHDPHSSDNPKFLVATNQFSELCYSCHDVKYWNNSSHSASANTWNGSGRDPWAHIDESYSTVAENACANCHNTHNANGKARLMKSELEENNCLDCHNGNVASTNIEMEVNKMYGHNVYKYNKIHDPLEQTETSSMHIECEDCHNPHATNNSLAEAPFASGAIAKVKGIDQNGIPVEEIQYEYELCYRCHSASNLKPASNISRELANNDIRLDFDPTNVSFHPIVEARNNPDVTSLISPYTQSSQIYCTDCHSSNGDKSPAGPHGSIYPQILKYSYNKNINEQNSLPENSDLNFEFALCAQCHSMDEIKISHGTMNTGHVLYKTNCGTCHDPHGFQGGNPLNNSFLINFDLKVISANTNGDRNIFMNGNGSGNCNFSCHSHNHVSSVYENP